MWTQRAQSETLFQLTEDRVDACLPCPCRATFLGVFTSKVIITFMDGDAHLARRTLPRPLCNINTVHVALGISVIVIVTTQFVLLWAFFLHNTVHVAVGLFLTEHSSCDYGPLSNNKVHVSIGCFLTTQSVWL